ncbi:MAG: helix-turn-helix domain-containing protein [Sphaerochaetaceae bacterium]|nr:helix-turn-helix domain-containing protein [Sphaerochaetaceae bacterium]
MDYISVKEASERWGISERRVRALCESGRIEGVTRCGAWVWSIPAGTQRPADGRTLRHIKNRSLRTGSQDFKKADALKKTRSGAPVNEETQIKLIRTAFALEDENLGESLVKGILRLETQDLPLETQINVLNMKSVLANLPYEVSDSSLKDVNRRLLINTDEKNGGRYSLTEDQRQQTEAMLLQYQGPWSVLHPVARAAFIFSEILRIRPFAKANERLAVVFLENELIKAKLPPAVLTADRVPEISAALASTRIRGNSQELVKIILEALEGK